MRALLILAAFGWLLSLPWTAILVGFVALLVMLAVGGYFVLDKDDRLRLPWRKQVTIDLSYVAALEAHVAEAEAQVAVLRDEVAQLHAASRAVKSDACAGATATVHRRVGLADNAPEWLVLAARRAYRSRLHPDRHPPRVKAEAERRFVEAEGVFEQINALRASP